MVRRVVENLRAPRSVCYFAEDALAGEPADGVEFCFGADPLELEAPLLDPPLLDPLSVFVVELDASDDSGLEPDLFDDSEPLARESVR